MPTSGPFGKVVGRSPADSSTASMMATPDLITSEDDCLSVCGSEPSFKATTYRMVLWQVATRSSMPGVTVPWLLYTTDIYPPHIEYREQSV